MTDTTDQPGRPVVHFEITGPDGDALRAFYRTLFAWDATPADAAPEVAAPGTYSFLTEPGGGVNGGIGEAVGAPHALLYVAVDDIEAALAEAERLGGERVLGPVPNPDGSVVVGWFRDPAGNLIGVAGPR
jgi:uncharacterized protein